ncbi:uncharacterized protein MONBRDRAFT_31454 [Monosiga brevicollis MX1]|uniref:Translin-associated factor X-interacting protein 1 N-terminal domain-containing protein n=1 Tax=Monosiga brevicollis TaxID=81824 RepID=A9UT94_MONBE|nr:uncharacterized protein MONBRDRAFT_31454 [Monosiga brevicollis MX1]EDQ91207.1 predicted protein [Monosiga brevicollis MX1]|eukprot:XP_001743629.1 hypothetical protein [Monosiga brevicollis MX1]
MEAGRSSSSGAGLSASPPASKALPFLQNNRLPVAVRLQPHRDAFQQLCEATPAYQPLLARLRTEYDAVIMDLDARIQELVALRQQSALTEQRHLQEVDRLREHARNEHASATVHVDDSRRQIREQQHRIADLEAQVQRLSDELVLESERGRNEKAARLLMVNRLHQYSAEGLVATPSHNLSGSANAALHAQSVNLQASPLPSGLHMADSVIEAELATLQLKNQQLQTELDRVVTNFREAVTVRDPQMQQRLLEAENNLAAARLENHDLHARVETLSSTHEQMKARMEREAKLLLTTQVELARVRQKLEAAGLEDVAFLCYTRTF